MASQYFAAFRRLPGKAFRRGSALGDFIARFYEDQDAVFEALEGGVSDMDTGISTGNRALTLYAHSATSQLVAPGLTATLVLDLATANGTTNTAVTLPYGFVVSGPIQVINKAVTGNAGTSTIAILDDEGNSVQAVSIQNKATIALITAGVLDTTHWDHTWDAGDTMTIRRVKAENADNNAVRVLVPIVCAVAS